MQHTTTHCSTLQHTAAQCSTLQHNATHGNTLQHCSTRQHTATHCNTLKHTATHCNTLQHTVPFPARRTTIIASALCVSATPQSASGAGNGTLRCSALQCSAVYCSVLRDRRDVEAARCYGCRIGVLEYAGVCSTEAAENVGINGCFSSS